MYANNSNPIGFQKMIEDVVESFSSCMKMTINFNGSRVTNGATIKPSMAITAPTIEFEGKPNIFYTLLLIDPDMPSPSDPHMREYIHWIVTDIPGSGTIDQGKEILPYTMPIPQRGIHRYLVMMYAQLSPLGLVEPPTDRAHFDSKRFAVMNELGVPQAIVCFCAKREPAARQQR